MNFISQSMILPSLANPDTPIEYITIERLDMKTVMSSPSSILIIGGDGMGKSNLGRYLYALLSREMNIAFIANERDRYKLENDVPNKNNLIFPEFKQDVVTGLTGIHTKLLLVDCAWDTLPKDMETFLIKNDGFTWRVIYVISSLTEIEGEKRLSYAWRFFFIRKYFVNSYIEKTLKWYPHDYISNYRKFHILFKLKSIISEDYFVELMNQMKDDICFVIDILTKRISWTYLKT